MSNSIGVVALDNVPRTIDGCQALRCSQRFSLMQQMNAFASHEDKLAFSSKPNDQPQRLLAALMQYDASNGGTPAQQVMAAPQMAAPPQTVQVAGAPPMLAQPPQVAPQPPPQVVPQTAAPQMAQPQMMPQMAQPQMAQPQMPQMGVQPVTQPAMAAPPMAVGAPPPQQAAPPTVGLPGAPAMAVAPPMMPQAPPVPDGREPAVVKATAAVSGKGKGKRGKKTEDVSDDLGTTILTNQQKLAASLEALAQGNEGMVSAIEQLRVQTTNNTQFVTVLLAVNTWLASRLAHVERVSLPNEVVAVFNDGSMNQLLALLGGQSGK